MATIDIAMPALGQSVAEGTVVRWLKKPGDVVARDEGLVAVQTDKAEAEVPSPSAGRLAAILVTEGATVEVGTVIGRLEVAESSISPATAPVQAPGALATPHVEPPLREARSEGSFLSPAVRRLARLRGVNVDDARRVSGTGRNGRVTLRDLEAHLARAGADETAGDVEIVPLTGMRLRIAEHMLAAKRSAPHVNTVAEIDMSAVSLARRRHGPAFKERHGFGLSWNAFLLKASAAALVEFPAVNAELDDRGIVMHRRVHLGMAVALEPSGLVVPVVRDAHLLTVRALAVEAQRLAERARKRELTADEMKGGTCTVTNPGVFGNLFGTPILHLPQAAIIDFGAIKKRAVVVSSEEGDAIAIRPMAYVVLAWDHRVMDGATAAKFLQRLVRELEAFPGETID